MGGIFGLLIDPVFCHNLRAVVGSADICRFCAPLILAHPHCLMKTSQRIRSAIIEIWATGAHCTTYTIADATAGVGATRPVAAKTVGHHLKRWALEGRAELQPNALRQGATAWRFPWGPEDATAADVLRVAFDGMSPSESRRLRTAMRHFLGLPRVTSPTKIIEAAQSIPSSELHGLSNRVAMAAEEAGLSPTTYHPWKSTTKAALVLAAQTGSVPVILPRRHEDDSWEKACHTWYYHDRDDGTKRTTRQTYASLVLRLRTILEEMQMARTPESLTEQELDEQVYPYILRELGSPSLVQGVRTALRYVGRVHGAGPYERLEGSDRGRYAEGYLRTADGRAGGFETLLEIFRAQGFADDVLEFLQWYRDYSRLPDSQLWEDPMTFPTRPSNRHLSESTWGHRMEALRAFGHHALEVCRPAGRDLTMEEVFGRCGIQIARRLELWWQRRADRGEVDSRHSKGLQQLLLHVGMAARAAFDRELHRKGMATTGDHDEPLQESAFLQPAAQGDQATAGYFGLYKHARGRASHFEALRKNALGGHKYTDRKSIRRIYERTPPAYWMAINRHLQDAIVNWQGKRGYKFHLLVRNSFIHAWVNTTGCRASSLAWVRLGAGEGYSPENRQERRVDWRAWQRKNQKAHSARLREAILPEWLEQLYLEESRHFFMRRGIDRNTLTSEHDFLIVKPSTGGSLADGWWPETWDERKQAGVRAKKGVNALRGSWQSAAAKAASELGLEWPTNYGEGGLHAIRNSIASGIYRQRGKEAAADYLGDSVDTVEDTYAAVDGIHVDPSELALDTLDLVAPVSQEVPERNGPGPNDELDRLRAENEELRSRIEHFQQVLGGGGQTG